MKQFKDFNIKNEVPGFVGDKIKMERLLNKKITIHKYAIEDSKVKQNTKCLYLQLTVDSVQRVNFSGSVSLMEMIKKVPANEFPFETIIIKENERFEFS